MRTTAFSIDTFYQQIGNGPIIVLLHGWGHNWETWNNLIPFLSSDFQLLIPDLPAFGQSKSPSNPQKWNLEKYVLWLDKFLKQTTNNKKIIL
ncbi:alpha/beta fold hydrolase, partial [Patescibacteria group bacterium]|nr:alpha/beta fold hydrolase [Patescibacteria group bacterium]